MVCAQLNEHLWKPPDYVVMNQEFELRFVFSREKANIMRLN